MKNIFYGRKHDVSFVMISYCCNDDSVYEISIKYLNEKRWKDNTFRLRLNQPSHN